MRLHCIGDSHTSFFGGYNCILPEYPEVGISVIENIFLYRIGAPLAYNLCEIESKSGSREKLFSVIKKLDSKQDYLMLCFGEIDCRAHLLRQAERQEKRIEDVVEDCVQRYLKVILEIKSLGFKVGIWNAIPSAIGVNNHSSEFPYYGSVIERNKATDYFNKLLNKLSEENDFHFFNIFNCLIDEKGTTKEEFYYDKIHLSSKILPYSLHLIQKNEPLLSFSSIAILKVRVIYFKNLCSIYYDNSLKKIRTIYFKLKVLFKRKLLNN